MLKEVSYVYYPQLGYVVKVPVSSRGREDLDENDTIPGLSFQFAAADHLFYKNERTEELDSSLGDIQVHIADIEVSLIREVASHVVKDAGVLCSMVEHVYHLDVIIAFALTAKQRGYSRPMLSEEPHLLIEDGRHPLQEVCVEQFIPNSTNSIPKCMDSAGSGKVKIITGPNNSGKSVYLKQVGLIVYMAHVGSFVPASSAIIGLTDRCVCSVAYLFILVVVCGGYFKTIMFSSHIYVYPCALNCVVLSSFSCHHQGSCHACGMSKGRRLL